MPFLSSHANHGFGLRQGTRSRSVRVLSWLAALVVLLVSTLAVAAPWAPPPLRGHVVDEAGALKPEEARALDRKLARARAQTGFAVVVYLLPQLPDGLAIEDVGYTAGNTWHVGSKAGDDGVLLIATINDRHLRIETGKGVGGGLTDLQSSHINREIIGPAMKEGRVYDAMNQGADAILKELVANTEGGKSEPGRDPTAARRGRTAAPHPATIADYAKFGIIGLIVLGVIVLAIVSPAFREMLFFMLLFGRGGGGGGGGRNDDDDDGGSGYGGGGGSFGGGGSSDDY